jgi:RimJ/RimL family protein N-acetyltransferase
VGDYPDFKATFASYRSRFLGGPLNSYEAWMLYAAEIGHWAIRGFGMWMIHDKASDETYGMAGGWFPAKWPEREIAWIIWPDKAGRGYALEATHAVRRHFYEVQGWDGAVSYIDPKNLDSIRLRLRQGSRRAEHRRLGCGLSSPAARHRRLRPDPRRDRAGNQPLLRPAVQPKGDAR